LQITVSFPDTELSGLCGKTPSVPDSHDCIIGPKAQLFA